MRIKAALLAAAFYVLSGPGRVWAGGIATVAPPGLQEGEATVSTLTFIVPAGGMQAGGQVVVRLPDNWWPMPQTNSPGMDGYVSSTTLSQGNLALAVSWASTQTLVAATLLSGTLSAGATIQLSFQNFHGCPSPNAVGTLSAQWQVSGTMDGIQAPTLVALQPFQAMLPGVARQLSFDSWDVVRVLAGQPSAPIGVIARDNCWRPAALAGPVTLQLSGSYGPAAMMSPDPSAQFSLNSDLSAPGNSFILTTGISTTTFYYRTSQTGTTQIAMNSAGLMMDTTNYRQGQVMAAFSFAGVGVDAGIPQNPLATTLNLTPDGDGVSDMAFIRFTPSDATLPWRVTISSDGFQSLVFDYSGAGNVLSQVSWDGHSRQGWQDLGVVPNGDYSVKIESPGLAQAPLLTIHVHTLSISGQVTLGGQGAPGVWVNAQANAGPGHSNTLTDAGGNFVLNGLMSGVYYNLYGAISSTAAAAAIQVQRNNVLAGSTHADLAAAQPGILRIHAVLPSSSTIALHGNLNIHPVGDWSRNYWGMVQLNAGDTDSANGDSLQPSSWTLVAVDPGNYAVQLNIPGYGEEDATALVAAGQTVDVSMTLQPRVNISGQIVLPSTVSWGTWVNVDVLLPGGGWANIPGGGAMIDVGQSSGTYWIYNVSSGSYRLVARAQGYVPLGLDATVAGQSLTGQDFTGFTTGGQIAGTVTVVGDTSGLSNPFSLWMNAWSPALQVNANTQVLTSTSASSSSAPYVLSGLADGTYQIYPPWLDGFNADPPGMRSVVVSGGHGALDVTLRQLSGQIYGTITLPSNPPPDYSQVQLLLSGPRSANQNATAAPYSFDHLDTGYYTLVAIYRTTGAQIRQMVPVVNGQSRRVDLDLSAPTHAVSGTVSLSGSLSLKDASGNPLSVSLLHDLRMSATAQTVYVDGNTSQGWMNQTFCSGGTAISTPTVRVEAFPKDLGSYGSTSRSGLDNCFGPGQFKNALFDDSGAYSISGLSPGVWEISVYPFFDGSGVPDIAWSKQVVTIADQDVSGVNFTLSQGHAVSGAISLPSGVSDFHTLQARVVTSRGDWVQSMNIFLGGGNGNSFSYRFDSLPDGDLSLVVQDMSSLMGSAAGGAVTNGGLCSTKTVPFTMKGGDIQGMDLTLSRAARIVGHVAVSGKNPDGTESLTMITSNSSSLLPSNYQIAAEANPYFDGGWQQAAYDGQTNRPAFDAAGQFVIDGLSAGNYDVHFMPNSDSAPGGSGLNLATLTKAQVHVEDGQTVDIGTVKLNPGLSLTGSVRDQSGHPLSNIQVEATPSNNSSNGDNSIRVLTDGQGNFTLTGLDPVSQRYDVVAARRPSVGETQNQAVPYGEVTKLAVDVTRIPPPTIDFVLPPAHGILTGMIVTADRGALSYPEDRYQGYPAAAVYLHRQGYLSNNDNPLGEITEMTGLDGRFRIINLVAGTYDVTLMSLNYRPVRMTVQVTDAQALDLGVVTLPKGPTLLATLKMPDGSPVTTSNVNFAAAVTSDFSSLVFGQINSDVNTRNILSIRFSGFELSPKTYAIVLGDQMGTITMPAEGQRVIFSGNDDSSQLALTYQPAQPATFVHATKAGQSVNLKFYFTGSLRNLGADQDPTQWVSVTKGQGSLSQHFVTADRTRFDVAYTPASGEETATIHFAAYSSQVNRLTNSEFLISKDLVLHFGQKAQVEKNISPILGGSLDLSDSDDPSTVHLPQNAISNSDGSQPDATTSFLLQFYATDDQTTVAAVSPSARVAQMAARKPEAYVSEAWAALASARSQRAINPFSAFYSVLLPAGVSHSLNQNATLTLSYSADADPNLLNVYFFNGEQYLIENGNRTIDPVNHTISVGVSHLSTFVVLQNSLPVIIVNGDAGSGVDIDVFNFPNPFDLETKTKTLNRGGSGASLATDGTIIRYFIPAPKAGAATITIYDVVGEKVRSLDLGTPATDTFNYVAWDGRNEAGRKVASGVYVGVLKVGGAKKFWKMAVIK